MSLLLAPYNNGMRLGQGFNSYTQQICIDDAVVVDPDRVDNAVTNDGFTMRELRYAISARAGGDDNEDYYDEESIAQHIVQPVASIKAFTNPEAIANTTTNTSTAPTTDTAVNIPTGDDGLAPRSQPLVGPAAPTALDSVSIQLSQDVQTMSTLIGDIAKLEAIIEDSLDPSNDATKRAALLLEKKRMRLARLKTTGTGLQASKRRTNAKELSRRGPSQIVTYNSRFVNKISEITDDMNISGSLSIKYGAIGGSGKGSFVDSDKFKESDLNFFISVKVINQSINVKDALVFQGLPSVNETNFRSVFGDSFISGFLEGGEFNALVSMKVVNKDKRMAVKAEAEIALSVGTADIKATAHVDINKSNFSSQTETTIQVGWSGGGHIKPMDQPWTIQTLMETAARFPDLVANTPQRTYAILTKYEALRSFMALRPPMLKPIYYENAAIYTNALLDAYMDYKNIYRNLGTQLFDIQAGTKKLEPWDDTPVLADATTLSKVDDESRFAATIKGIDLARRACRFQMMKIVTEVDAVEDSPDLAAQETRAEMFQSSIAFRERLPVVKNVQKLPHLKIFGTDVPYPALLERVDGDGVQDAEATKAADYAVDRPDVGEFLKLAPMVGSVKGTFFCNLDFIKSDFSLRTVTVNIHRGVVVGLGVRYANGLLAAIGTSVGDRKLSMTVHPEDGERIIACSVETGRIKGDTSATTQVTAVRMYTNRGPDLLGNAQDWKPAIDGKGLRDGVEFEDLSLKHFDPLLVNAHIKGFWGYAVTTSRIMPDTGIYRLAPIWGNKESVSATVGVPVGDTVDQSTIVTEAEAFYISAREQLGWKDAAPGRCGTIEHRFKRVLPIVPTVLYGFRTIDFKGTNGPRVALSLPSVSESGFSLSAKSFLHETFNLEANIMVLPNGVIPFQHGYVDASDAPNGRTPKQNAAVPIKFATPFKTPPKVLVWFTEVSIPRGHRSLRTFVSSVTPQGMTVNIETWAQREFDGARVAWLAWPAEFDGKTIRSDSDLFYKDTGAKEFNWYGGSFSKDPKVFSAIYHLDFTENEGVSGTTVKHEWATKDRLRWQGFTWGDAVLAGLGHCWLAIE